MKVKGESEVAQSGPTLSDPMDCSLPGSSVHRYEELCIILCSVWLRVLAGESESVSCSVMFDSLRPHGL